MLKDHERHVLDEPRKNRWRNVFALCGAPISGLWHFQSVSHAFLTRQQEGRLMICPECLEIIKRVFEN